jgi:hypothetical protein
MLQCSKSKCCARPAQNSAMHDPGGRANWCASYVPSGFFMSS